MRIKLIQRLTGTVTWETADGKQRLAYPDPGEEFDLPDNLAKALIESGHAKAVKKSKK